MFFCKTINSCCKDVVPNEPHFFFINKCCIECFINNCYM